MRAFSLLFVLGFLALASASSVQDESEGRTITKVVKLLQKMLDKSVEDGKTDLELYGKFKCYCDKNTEEKQKTIAEADEQIPLLQAKIDDLKASTGELSSENAKLEKDIAENEKTREEAEALRAKAHEDFLKEESDMETAIGAMGKAIDVLAAVGADQTKSTSADHERFMAKDATASAKGSLAQLKADIQQALVMASTFVSEKDVKTVQQFVQLPGNYNAQSGEIVGILKNMKDTFSKNLVNARAAEKKAAEEHVELMEIKMEEYTTMKDKHEKNSKQMAENDKQLASTEEELGSVKDTRAAAIEFLDKLTEMCSQKSKLFEDRKLVRAQEEAAISQAIAILNSDDAFDNFGKVSATATGATGFVQIHRRNAVAHATRKEVQAMLQKAARSTSSLRLAQVAAALADSPFTKVLALIDDMKALVDKEQKADEDKKKWCDDERETTKGTIKTLTDEISDLTDKILKNEEDIESKKTSIMEASDSLDENRQSQKDETQQRSDEHKAYVKDSQNLNEAEGVLKKAIHVLKKFYAYLHSKQGAHHYEEKAGKDFGGGNLRRIAGASVEELETACTQEPQCAGFNTAGWLKSEVDAEKLYDWSEGSLYVKVFDEKNPAALNQEDPTPPETFGETFEGQRGQGNDVVKMLEFIQTETHKEADEAHTGEKDSQISYEESMTSLVAEEKTLVQTIADLTKQKADLEQELEENIKSKAEAEQNKRDQERYLRQIKPGCDFMDQNFDARTEARTAEKAALDNASTKLKEVEEKAGLRAPKQ